MMGLGYGMSGGIGMVLFWGLIIVLAVFLVRALADGNRPNRETKSRALDILAERYAKGDISKEEYDERRKTLSE